MLRKIRLNKIEIAAILAKAVRIDGTLPMCLNRLSFILLKDSTGFCQSIVILLFVLYDA